MDYKKEYKELYMPKNTPMLVNVPSMPFIMIDGKGDPSHDSYQKAVEILYGLSYIIKMSKKKGLQPTGYFEYVVPPLESLWWSEEIEFERNNRESWYWTSMIRLPEFVDETFFKWACDEMKHKKPELSIDKAKFVTFNEGLCIQMMHIGPYSEEIKSIESMKQYMTQNHLSDMTGKVRKHHEIYLSDPRKVEPNKLKTVLRHPVERK